MASETELQAVLDRQSLALSTVLSFGAGMVVPLTSGAIGRVRVEGHGGRLVATGRLGQCGGQVAVRLSLPAPGPEGPDDIAAGDGVDGADLETVAPMGRAGPASATLLSSSRRSDLTLADLPARSGLDPDPFAVGQAEVGGMPLDPVDAIMPLV